MKKHLLSRLCIVAFLLAANGGAVAQEALHARAIPFKGTWGVRILLPTAYDKNAEVNAENFDIDAFMVQIDQSRTGMDAWYLTKAQMAKWRAHLRSSGLTHSEGVAQILEYYSVKYGDKVDGWWVDRCGGMKPTEIRLYAKAIRAGNDDAIIAMHMRVGYPLRRFQQLVEINAAIESRTASLSQQTKRCARTVRRGLRSRPAHRDPSPETSPSGVL